MTLEENIQPSFELAPAKMILCSLPDDGRDLDIMRQLREEKNINRAFSRACRAVKNLQTAKVRFGELPEPVLYRLLTVIVMPEEADDVFNFVCERGKVGQAGNGSIVETTLIGATPYVLPEGMAEKGCER